MRLRSFFTDHGLTVERHPNVSAQAPLVLLKAIVQKRGRAAAAEHPLRGKRLLDANNAPRKPSRCSLDGASDRHAGRPFAKARAAVSAQRSHQKTKWQYRDGEGRDGKQSGSFRKLPKFRQSWRARPIHCFLLRRLLGSRQVVRLFRSSDTASPGA